MSNPIPGTARRRGGHVHRRPRTTRDKRWAQVADPEDIAPRACRRGRQLANARDDYMRSDLGRRTWKHYRRHQWFR